MKRTVDAAEVLEGRTADGGARESRPPWRFLSPWRSLPPWLSAAALFLSLGFYLFYIYRDFNWVHDDCFIFMRYALNFVQGSGWVMNRGERVEGCTSPLMMAWYTLLLRLMGGADGIDRALLTTKIVGICLGLLTLRQTRAIGRLLFPRALWAADLGMLLLALRETYAVSMINGLETAFAAAFLTGGLRCLLEAWDREEGWTLWGASLLFLGAGLSRPELSVMFPVLLLVRRLSLWDRGSWDRGSPGKPSVWNGLAVIWRTGGTGGLRSPSIAALRADALPLVLYLLPMAAVTLARRFYYGDWLPNTYYAKHQAFAHAAAGGWSYLGRFAAPNARYDSWLTPFLGLLAGVAGLLLWLGRGAPAPTSLPGRGQRLIRETPMRWLLPLALVLLALDAYWYGAPGWFSPVSGWQFTEVGLLTGFALSGRYRWALGTLMTLYGLFLLAAGGDWMEDGRFLTPLLPLFALAWAAPLAAVAAPLQKWSAGHRMADKTGAGTPTLPRICVSVAGLFLAASSCSHMEPRDFVPLATSRQNLRSLAWTAHYLAHPLQPHGAWLASHDANRQQAAAWIQTYVRPGGIVEIGEIGFTSVMNMDKTMIDTWGLSDRSIAHMDYEHTVFGVTPYYWNTRFDGKPAENQRQMERYLATRHPDALVLYFWCGCDRDLFLGSRYVPRDTIKQRQPGCMPLQTWLPATAAAKLKPLPVAGGDSVCE